MSSNKKHCTIISIEIGFWRGLNRDIRLAEKTEKYSPLIPALKKY